MFYILFQQFKNLLYNHETTKIVVKNENNYTYLSHLY